MKQTRKCIHCGWTVEAPCNNNVEARGCQLYRDIHYGEGDEVHPVDELHQAEKALKAKQGDAVTLPGHYTRWKIEPIYFIEENKMPFWMGNVIKYVTRADAKNGIEDLKKARRYIDMKVKQLEGNPDWSK